MNKTYFVTGCSGYVGKILVSKLLEDQTVEKIVCSDKTDLSNEYKSNSKIVFIHKNLVDEWESEVEKYKPQVVVHLAWQIRTMYNNEKLQGHWNIGGSQKVFDFVKRSESVKTFVVFSTVASYGAYTTNTFENVFSEDVSFRKTDYLYAEEKRIMEENLHKTFSDSGGKNIFVIRPASITGKCGRERTGFGLQSALSGKIKNENLLFKLISFVLKFMPATKLWARQFVHENDIVNAVIEMSRTEKVFPQIEVFNLCPPGGYITAKEMGEMLNKKVIYFHPRLVQLLCFLAWHGTRGRVPTSSGVWSAYSYPIVVDGTKIEELLNFKYSKDIRQAYTE